jgi:predicted 3-demethylubiquinone-9 3-methyltransferase (glyoxalase superfamily)
MASPKINPMLWYASEALVAAKFYVSVFKKSKIVQTLYYPEGAMMPAGTVMVVDLLIEGHRFSLLNGGDHYKMNGATSWMVHCKDQKEIDRLWTKLVAGGGKHYPCGWLEDRWGVHWQIVPQYYFDVIKSKDKKKIERIHKAYWQMQKPVIADLKKAVAGKK